MPFNTPTQMMVYTTLQELATQLNYRRLRELARQENDEALVATLNFIGRDEAAHHKFFKDGVKLLIEEDRDKTLEDIQIVLSQFKMPAIDLIPDWQEYLNTIVDMGLFSARLYMTDVVQPVLKAWDISRSELKTVMQESGTEGSPRYSPLSTSCASTRTPYITHRTPILTFPRERGKELSAGVLDCISSRASLFTGKVGVVPPGFAVCCYNGQRSPQSISGRRRP